MASADISVCAVLAVLVREDVLTEETAHYYEQRFEELYKVRRMPGSVDEYLADLRTP